MKDNPEYAFLSQLAREGDREAGIELLKAFVLQFKGDGHVDYFVLQHFAEALEQILAAQQCGSKKLGEHAVKSLCLSGRRISKRTEHQLICDLVNFALADGADRDRAYRLVAEAIDRRHSKPGVDSYERVKKIYARHSA